MGVNTHSLRIKIRERARSNPTSSTDALVLLSVAKRALKHSQDLLPDPRWDQRERATPDDRSFRSFSRIRPTRGAIREHDFCVPTRSQVSADDRHLREGVCPRIIVRSLLSEFLSPCEFHRSKHLEAYHLTISSKHISFPSPLNSDARATFSRQRRVWRTEFRCRLFGEELGARAGRRTACESTKHADEFAGRKKRDRGIRVFAR